MTAPAVAEMTLQVTLPRKWTLQRTVRPGTQKHNKAAMKQKRTLLHKDPWWLHNLTVPLNRKCVSRALITKTFEVSLVLLREVRNRLPVMMVTTITNKQQTRQIIKPTFALRRKLPP